MKAIVSWAESLPELLPMPLLVDPVGNPRSSHWPAARAAHLKREPQCRACGGREHLEVHHIWPYGWPNGAATELVDENMVTLCMSPGHGCHLMVGHLGSYHSRNPNVLADADTLRHKIVTRPYPEKIGG